MDLQNIMLHELFYIIIRLFLVFYTCQTTSTQDVNLQKNEGWRFKDFIKKFDPDVASERVRKAFVARGSNHSSGEYIENVIRAMDVTDEMMKLKVQNIGPEIIAEARNMSKDARRWQPSPGINPYRRDPFDVRVRLYELMRQAIYQARNSMVVMQIMREKYRNSSLYKMGFLMSKTDNAVKTFSKFAYRALRQCTTTRQENVHRMFLYETLLLEERLLNLWFNAQLLIELVNRNDVTCAEVLTEHTTDRIKNWKYEE